MGTTWTAAEEGLPMDLNWNLLTRWDIDLFIHQDVWGIWWGKIFCEWPFNWKLGTNHYFLVVLFSTLYKVALTFELWMKFQSVTILMKATEQYISPVLLFLTDLPQASVSKWG